jgi:prophage endopeptidase
LGGLIVTIYMKAGLVLLLVACSVFSTWKVGAWRYENQLSEQARLHQADLTAISNVASAQARQALERQQAAERARDEIDEKATMEKTHDLAENERLRRVADDSARRLRIAGSCSSGGSNVSGPAVGSSLDDGRAFELSTAAGQTVFDIRAGIIADQSALKALQWYVREVCHK